MNLLEMLVHFLKGAEFPQGSPAVTGKRQTVKNAQVGGDIGARTALKPWWVFETVEPIDLFGGEAAKRESAVETGADTLFVKEGSEGAEPLNRPSHIFRADEIVLFPHQGMRDADTDVAFHPEAADSVKDKGLEQLQKSNFFLEIFRYYKRWFLPVPIIPLLF
ncbi:MAG: hypothetical protein JXB25_06435 [Deltaproteobacteria bacterium]|nr:hypothetical protein [Deltaproteobacteria bacterium]